MKGKQFLLFMMLVFIIMTGCGQKEASVNDSEIEQMDLAELQDYMQGKSIGIITGTLYEHTAEELFAESELKQFNSENDSLIALKSHKTDSLITNTFASKEFLLQNPDLFASKVLLKSFGCAFAVDKKNSKLQKEINDTIANLKSSGKYDEIYQKWIDGDSSEWAMPTEELSGENGVLRIATPADTPPFSMIMNEEIVGFDMELLFWAAYEHGYSIEIQTMTFAGIIPAVASGKADVAANTIVITPERAEQVLFTDPYIQNSHMMMFLRNEITTTGFISKIKESFQKNYIRENRWKLILSGIGVTIVISVFAVLLGSALGFGICLLRRSKRGYFSIPARVYIRIMQGTPILVILMIAYYIVFGKTQINAIVVAIIAFAMNFGAYVSETLRTGIQAVDIGQTEAAYAMGVNKVDTFMKIVFPQAVKNCMPVYKGEIISLVKSTSIVGYIAIQDLTKVSDMIRSRTYEAFFPLISTAVIYFVLSYILLCLLNFIEFRMNGRKNHD